MNLFLKKISASLLLFAAAVPFLFILFVHIKQQAIRHEMKEKLEYQFLQTITLAANEITWVKPGKEILVGGKMFDVKSHTVDNGRHTFTGLFDDEETTLVGLLKKEIQKNNEAENTILNNIFLWLHSFYPNNEAEISIPHHSVDLNFCFIYVRITSPGKEIPTPPPQI